jgi:tetratricopeptide (TPR) repeat protein
MYSEMKMYNEAAASLNQAILNRPDYAAAYEELGVVQRMLGRNYEAIASLNKAIQLDPEAGGAYMGLGDVYYYGTKEYQKAINAYVRGLQYDNDNHVATYNIGWAYNELGNYKEAIRYAELWYANYKLKQDVQAINSYKRALQYKPDHANSYFGIADVYYENLKNYQLAADYYRKGLAYKPDDASALYRLGFCYNDLGNYQEAINVLARAKQLNPEWVGVHTELGYSYMKLQRYNEAITSLRQAIAVNKDAQVARYYLGLIYVYTNNRNAAMNEYRELQRLNSDYAPKLLNVINGR